MKNTIKVFWNLTRASRRLVKVPLVIIAFVTMIGFSMTACNGYIYLPGRSSNPDPGTPPSISTATLPGGLVGTAYYQTLTVGGDTPLTYNLIGALPTGLYLGASIISGIPTAAGTFTFTVRVTNDAGSDMRQLTIIIGTAIEMVHIEGGTFAMGSPENEPGRNAESETQHEVTLTGFSMGKYPVTQAQYEAVMGSNPSYFKGYYHPETSTAKRPVETVKWYDAIIFCNKLSMIEGLSPAYRINGSTDPAAWGTIPTELNNETWDAVESVAGSTGYRLPTEAQWEYACRAGTTAAFNTGGDGFSPNLVWYFANSDNRTHSVGEKPANAWGLYDMHGNVWEWCWDWYEPYTTEPQTDPMGAFSHFRRVRRGGSWNDVANSLRTANRETDYPSSRSRLIGFRLARP